MLEFTKLEESVFWHPPAPMFFQVHITGKRMGIFHLKNIWHTRMVKIMPHILFTPWIFSPCKIS